MNSAKRESRLWSIVLAAGEESRIGPLIRSWLGSPKPKQYCTFVGTRSLLQHTLDRAAKLSEWEHVIVVVSQQSEQDARRQLKGRAGCTLLPLPHPTVQSEAVQK